MREQRMQTTDTKQTSDAKMESTELRLRSAKLEAVPRPERERLWQPNQLDVLWLSLIN